jgi:hypothetical protein
MKYTRRKAWRPIAIWSSFQSQKAGVSEVVRYARAEAPEFQTFCRDRGCPCTFRPLNLCSRHAGRVSAARGAVRLVPVQHPVFDPNRVEVRVNSSRAMRR